MMGAGNQLVNTNHFALLYLITWLRNYYIKLKGRVVSSYGKNILHLMRNNRFFMCWLENCNRENCCIL